MGAVVFQSEQSQQKQGSASNSAATPYSLAESSSDKVWGLNSEALVNGWIIRIADN